MATMDRSVTDTDARAQRRVGTVLRGKYRLDRVLGVGGMAAVYKATHRNRAEFAVKMLHPELSQHTDLRTRFLREGYAANSVKHPGVVRVVDDDIAEDGSAFLVMEHLDGEACDTLWEQYGHRVPAALASLILLQLLDVLAAAHAQGVVHRDIKPGNLFLTRDGTLKVLDFGIARARDVMTSEGHSTGTGMLLGTPAFMPPEQALAKSSEIGGPTDLWAAGATFFALVSGRTVHEAENAPQMMVKAATEHARSVTTVAPVPPAIAQVIDRALAFAREQRWPTAMDMREALLAAHRVCYGEPHVQSLVSLFHVGPAMRLGTEGPAAVAMTPPAGTPPGGRSPAAQTVSDATGAMHPVGLIGRSTAGPVATDARAASSRSRRWVAAGLGAGTVVVLLSLTWFVRGGGVGLSAGPTASGSSATTSPSVPLPSAPMTSDSVAPDAANAAPSMLAPSTPATVPPPLPLPSAPPAPSSPSSPANTGAAPAAPHPPKPKSQPQPHPTAASPSAAPECDVPYYFDAHGNRIFKKECL
jgi:serine/threonine-protein kinase